MLLITEKSEDVRSFRDSADGKHHFIEGIFMQAAIPNRNGRMYPKHTLFEEVDRFVRDLVNKNRAVGELGHPDTPKVIEERISHRIISLRKEGNDIIGKAKILDTPLGKIAKTLIDEDVSFGVSTRGLGSLKLINGVNEVQKDYRLTAVDIVHDPSAPDAFVQGVMEGKEWVMVANGEIIEGIQRTIRKTSARDLEAVKIRLFREFIECLTNR